MKHSKSKTTGIYYAESTPDEVREALDAAYLTGRRVRVWYGNTATGAAHPEEEGVTGFVGVGEKRSGGRTISPPVLLGQRRSRIGVEIDTRALVGIQMSRAQGGGGGEWAYRHPNLKLPVFKLEKRAGGTMTTVKRWSERSGSWVPYAEFSGPRAVPRARRLVDFMTGERITR